MTTVRVPLSYRPLPQQDAFHRSKARIRGFGGAMAGGKTRALCEDVFDNMLEMPGIYIPIVRQKHTAIVDTTRRQFYEKVLPPEIATRKDLCRIKQSQGEDFCELWNGSRVTFVGLDDPGKFFSAEYGMVYFDEAHEIRMEDVLTVNTRLRQQCPACAKQAATYLDPENAPDCNHYPHSMTFAFNPSYPGHWLQQFFVLAASRTEWGFQKDELIPPGSDFSIGDAEFFLSRAADNKYLPKGYIDKNLSGLSTMQRRRYLDGLWEHVDGSGFFDADALAALTQAALDTTPVLVGEPAGDLTGTDKTDRPRFLDRRTGRLEVWAAPVRLHVKDDLEVKAHRYVVGIDSSSGASSDYSGIQVVDVDEYAQVAEWQGKVDPDKLAEVAFLIGCVYNGALLAPEITGGFGFAVAKRLQALIGKWHGPVDSKPRIYTRPIRDRLSQKWTDLVGWDTQTKSRAEMLTILEEALRDGSLQVYGQRTLAELAAFAFGDPSPTSGEYRSPRARQGAHDDLVIPLAIAATIAYRLPKQLHRPPPVQDTPEFAATGW